MTEITKVKMSVKIIPIKLLTNEEMFFISFRAITFKKKLVMVSINTTVNECILKSFWLRLNNVSDEAAIKNKPTHEIDSKKAHDCILFNIKDPSIFSILLK